MIGKAVAVNPNGSAKKLYYDVAMLYTAIAIEITHTSKTWKVGTFTA